MFPVVSSRKIEKDHKDSNRIGRRYLEGLREVVASCKKRTNKTCVHASMYPSLRTCSTLIPFVMAIVCVFEGINAHVRAHERACIYVGCTRGDQSVDTLGK